MLLFLTYHTICSVFKERRELPDEITFPEECQGHIIQLDDNTPRTLSMGKNDFFCIDNRDSVIYAFGKRLKFEGTYSSGFQSEAAEAFGATLKSTKVTSLARGKVTFMKVYYPELESGQELYHVLVSKWKGFTESIYRFNRDGLEKKEKIIQVVNPLMSTVTVTGKDKIMIECDNLTERNLRGKKKGRLITISVFSKKVSDGRKKLHGKYKAKANIVVRKDKTPQFYPEKIIKIERNRIYTKDYKSDKLVSPMKIPIYLKVLITLALYVGSFVIYFIYKDGAEPDNDLLTLFYSPLIRLPRLLFFLIFCTGFILLLIDHKLRLKFRKVK